MPNEAPVARPISRANSSAQAADSAKHSHVAGGYRPVPWNTERASTVGPPSCGAANLRPNAVVGPAVALASLALASTWLK